VSTQISKPVNVTNRQAKKLAKTWSAKPTRNQIEYAKYFLGKVAALPKDVPMDDERRKPNLLVPFAMSMPAPETEGIGLIRKMRIDPLAKSMVLIPIYIKAVSESKGSVSEVCLIAGDGMKEVDAKEWLAAALRKKIGKRMFKSDIKGREARIENILSFCKFEGNRIYLNPASRVEIVDAWELETQKTQSEPNGKKVAAATGVPLAETAMMN